MKTALLLLCGAAWCAAGQPVPEAGANGAECHESTWVKFKNNCYCLLPESLENSLAIGVARGICKAFRADIISINNEEENAFLLRTFKIEWKGHKEILLGMYYDADESALKWYDGSNVTYTNWRDEQQYDEGLDTCTKMNTTTGLWDLVTCEDFREMETLCKKRIDPLIGQVPLGQIVFFPLMITVLLVVVVVMPVLFILYKKKILSCGFRSENLNVDSQVLFYTDEDILVDSLEK